MGSKIITTLFIVFLAVILLIARVCGGREFARQQTDKQEKQAQSEIIERACEEINEEEEWGTADPKTAELQYLFKESAPWMEWDCYLYVLETNGRKYLVGVQRDATKIHFVDVEEDITGRSDYGTVTIRG